jgi:GGDEF domain-containing protein
MGTSESVVKTQIWCAVATYLLIAIRHEGVATSTVEHHCSASIGVTLFRSDTTGQDDIFKWADAAMYQAKMPDAIRFGFMTDTGTRLLTGRGEGFIVLAVALLMT